jgi:hypothetical protein
VIVLVVSHNVMSMANVGMRGRSGDYGIWLIAEIYGAVLKSERQILRVRSDNRGHWLYKLAIGSGRGEPAEDGYHFGLCPIICDLRNYYAAHGLQTQEERCDVNRFGLRLQVSHLRHAGDYHVRHPSLDGKLLRHQP